MNKMELTANQIKPIIKYVIENNVKLAEKGIVPKAICIEGEAGIAKTSIVSQICAEYGDQFYFVKLNPAQLEVSDVIGYPITETEICKDKICKWVSKESLNDFILQGYKSTGQHRMNYAIPSWIQGKTDKPVVLCLDDYSRSSSIMLQSLMEVINEQKYISWSLPKGSTVICTSNPENGDYLVTVGDDAQKSRLLQLYMKADVSSWALWATNNVKECFINFLEENKEIIEGTNTNNENDQKEAKGNLRSWTNYFQAIENVAINSDKDEVISENWYNIVHPLGAGSLPEEHLMMLKLFLSKKLDKLPTAKEIVKTKNIEDKIEKLLLLVKDRQDISSMIGKRLFNYCIVNYKSFTPDMVNNFIKILENDILTQDQFHNIVSKLQDKEYNNVFNLVKSKYILDKIIA